MTEGNKRTNFKERFENMKFIGNPPGRPTGKPPCPKSKTIEERRKNRKIPIRPRRPVDQMSEEFAFQIIERFENNFPVSSMDVVDSMKRLEIEKIETEECILTIKKL